MNSKTNVDCCADGHEGPALILADALARILAEVEPVGSSETLAVRSTLGRVLAADVADPGLVERRGGHQRTPSAAAARAPEAQPSSWNPQPW